LKGNKARAANAGTGYNIVGNSLTVIGDLGTQITIENATGDQRKPRISWDVGNANYTVVYEDDRNFASTRTDVYGRLLKPNGTVLPAFGIATTTGDELAPQTSVHLSSPSQTEVLFYQIPPGVTFDYGVYLQSLNNGALVGGNTALATQAGVREQSPSIACGPNSLFCISVYRSFNPSDTQTGVDRIKAKTIFYP